MKVLLNNDYGGYSLSQEFVNHLIANNLVTKDSNTYTINRDNQIVIEEAIKFGLENASGLSADLKIVNIPDGCEYRISEYDGSEWIEQIWIDVTLDNLKNGLSNEQLSMVLQGCDIKCIN